MVTKPAGRDPGLLKEQANHSKGMTTMTSSQTSSGKTATQKSAVEKLNDYWLTESAHLEERGKCEHDFKMAQASNNSVWSSLVFWPSGTLKVTVTGLYIFWDLKRPDWTNVNQSFSV